MIKRDDEKNNEILGIMIVYVDDFLLQAPTGPIRDTFLKSLSVLWTLAKEEVLSHQHSIVFLGIEIEEQSSGDYLLHQTKFVESLMHKHGLSPGRGTSCVTIEKLPEESIPPTASD